MSYYFNYIGKKLKPRKSVTFSTETKVYEYPREPELTAQEKQKLLEEEEESDFSGFFVIDLTDSDNEIKEEEESEEEEKEISHGAKSTIKSILTNYRNKHGRNRNPRSRSIFKNAQRGYRRREITKIAKEEARVYWEGSDLLDSPDSELPTLPRFDFTPSEMESKRTGFGFTFDEHEEALHGILPGGCTGNTETVDQGLSKQ
ncbi:ORF29 [Ostreid herpesvirus 1]|uniref:Uncharacterized protein ORF29 n=1 Tax=Ostreid herpesvirus 1 (isolate France) TaxID=654903 RepID=Y029_OSHVF|nr:ORF29 [Ostreid herpesvirus 1]Q6R7J4.1 RecName: Full=Uncharacterized protein ORF29 [Ostreid herpesvirus 1 (isolate France)]AAS00921.1 ORF29 [Ostreid herpesvirus 1]